MRHVKHISLNAQEEFLSDKKLKIDFRKQSLNSLSFSMKTKYPLPSDLAVV